MKYTEQLKRFEVIDHKIPNPFKDIKNGEIVLTVDSITVQIDDVTVHQDNVVYNAKKTYEVLVTIKSDKPIQGKKRKETIDYLDECWHDWIITRVDKAMEILEKSNRRARQ